MGSRIRLILTGASAPSRRSESTTGRPAGPVVSAMAARGVLGGVPAARLWPGRPDVEDLLILACTETNTDDDCDRLVACLQEVLA